jgi:AbrB family looped-hinge helix DNA binding protein
MHAKREACMSVRELVGEVKISSRGAVNLPARALRELGWKHGDRVFVEVVDDDLIILSRRPENIADALAGRLTHLFPNHEENLRFIEEERASWDELDQRLDDE